VKKIIILFAIVLVAVLVGIQFPQKAFAQAGGKAYVAARGEIHPIDASTIANYEARVLNKECAVMTFGAPKSPSAARMPVKGAMRLFVCGTSGEPYCVTQAGKQVCYPPPR
jgi:hypothetical protein